MQWKKVSFQLFLHMLEVLKVGKGKIKGREISCSPVDTWNTGQVCGQKDVENCQ